MRAILKCRFVLVNMLTVKLISNLTEGRIEEAASCLNAGADPNGLSTEGAAAMHIAAGIGVEAVRLLLLHGGDPNVRSEDGSTPLHVAAAWGDKETLQLLLKNGADPNLLDTEGQRPVDIARSEGYPECADLLRYYGMLVAIGDEEESPRFTEEPVDVPNNFIHSSLSPPACKRNNACLSNSSSDEEGFNVSREYSEALSRRLSRLLHTGESACLDVTSPDCPYLGQKHETLGSGAANRTILAADDPLFSDSSTDSIGCAEEKETVCCTPHHYYLEAKTAGLQAPWRSPEHKCSCLYQQSVHSCEPEHSCMDMQYAERLERTMQKKYFPDLQGLDSGHGWSKNIGAASGVCRPYVLSSEKKEYVSSNRGGSPSLGAACGCKMKQPLEAPCSSSHFSHSCQHSSNQSKCSCSPSSAAKSLTGQKIHLFSPDYCQQEAYSTGACSSLCQNCHRNKFLKSRHYGDYLQRHSSSQGVQRHDTCRNFSNQRDLSPLSKSCCPFNNQSATCMSGSAVSQRLAPHKSQILQNSCSDEQLSANLTSKSLLHEKTTYQCDSCTCKGHTTHRSATSKDVCSSEKKSSSKSFFLEHHTSQVPSNCKIEATGPTSPVTVLPVLLSSLNGPPTLSRRLFNGLGSKHLMSGMTYNNHDDDDDKLITASRSSHSTDSGYCSTLKVLSPGKLKSDFPDSLHTSYRLQKTVQEQNILTEGNQSPDEERASRDGRSVRGIKDADDFHHTSLSPKKVADSAAIKSASDCSSQPREPRGTRRFQKINYLKGPDVTEGAEMPMAGDEEKKCMRSESSSAVSKNSGDVSASRGKSRLSFAELSISSVDTNDSFQTCQEASSETESIAALGSQTGIIMQSEGRINFPEDDTFLIQLEGDTDDHRLGINNSSKEFCSRKKADAWRRESGGFDVSSIMPNPGSPKDSGTCSKAVNSTTILKPQSKLQDDACGVDNKNSQQKTGYTQECKSGFLKPPRRSGVWAPPTGPLPDDSDLITSDESFVSKTKKNCENRKIDSVSSNNVTRWLQNIASFPNSTISNKRRPRLSEDSLLSTSSTREYIYRDEEKGITLLERHIPSECSSSCSNRTSLESVCSLDSQATVVYDWKDASASEAYKSSDTTTSLDFSLSGHTMASECTDPEPSLGNATSIDGKVQTESLSEQASTSDREDTSDRKSSGSTREGPVSTAEIPPELKSLSDEAIFQSLKELGESPGPVQAGTRQTYLRRLASLRSGKVKLSLATSPSGYSSELNRLLSGSLDLEDLVHAELVMVAQFQTPGSRTWREGNIKSCFNYLLLDPRVTKNLPLRAKSLSDLEGFKTFLLAIFYIGKGKRSRPYCHLYEAISQLNTPKQTASKKIQQILDVWASNQGVISLHCFQNVIPVEAYTREACMVDAIGLERLTNVKRGDYYGVASTWPATRRRAVGAFLLRKAYQIFLAEGERQICPVDIKNER